MALVLPDGFGLCRISWRVAGPSGDGETVIGLTIDVDVITDANLVFTSIDNDLMSEMAVSVYLERVRITARNGAVYTQGDSTQSEVQGGRADPSAPPNVTYLVQKRSAAPGRSGIGRMYLPGVIEGDVDSGGFLSGTQLTTMQTVLDNLFSDLAPLTPVLLHRNPAAPNDYDFAPPTTITSFNLESLVATQRRRLR